MCPPQDFFPEQAQGGMPPRTAVYASTDGGASWRLRAEVWYQYCSSLFLHRGAVQAAKGLAPLAAAAMCMLECA